jgi:hypothetical protein
MKRIATIALSVMTNVYTMILDEALDCNTFNYSTGCPNTRFIVTLQPGSLR